MIGTAMSKVPLLFEGILRGKYGGGKRDCATVL
jgi:hypothetical protein